ncbi:PAS domain-containing protein [Tardiphaga alba]|uniref:histidine kinase n=1 Tax=Tardiphaga alba TaxID=340268 RepID=A0ABX8AG30_9BRAD|nr:PAS domain-containing protein [Tardiphaga alba]QUS41569.1 PAS domain-containing protein [Tardiphaga alba]
MSDAIYQLRGVGDARLAAYATGIQPAWLWSLDGTRVLWANPVGTRIFGARNAADLFAKPFGPADPHRRQMSQLATRMPVSGATRLERLRGFGAPLGGLMTCACTRLDFDDGSAGILIVAAETPGGRGMPLVERLQNLVEGIDTPIAAFARDGLFVGASETARALLGFRNLADAGLDQARDHALKDGRAETPIGFGRMVLQRVGSGSDIGLVALIAPGAVHPAPEEETLGADISVAEAQEATPVAPALPTDVIDVDPDLADWGQAEAALMEPSAPVVETAPAEPVVSEPPAPTGLPATPQSLVDLPTEPLPSLEPRAIPLRFVWQLDADDTFTLTSDEFKRLIGPHASAMSDRKWSDISAEFALDPDHHFAQALATRQTWSNVTLLWPVDDGGRLAVEMAALPLFDRAQNFTGYRGFGICRDIDGMNRLIEQRHHEAPDDPPPRPLSADIVQAGPVDDPVEAPITPPDSNISEPTPPDTTLTNQPDLPVQPPENVVHLRPSDPKSPALTPVENSAFNELARRLSARLESETVLIATPPDEVPAIDAGEQDQQDPPATWLASPPSAPRGEMLRDRMLLDLMPVGVMIYRLDRLLYANPAFLARLNYPTLTALEDAGGLDMLQVEADVSAASSASDGGTTVTIAANDKSGEGALHAPASARMFSITWDNEPAHVLIFSTTQAEAAGTASAVAPAPEPVTEPVSEAGHVDAEDLAAILDTMAEGVVMFDAEGNINSCNRSAEALFGYDGEQLTQRNVVDVFAHESRRIVSDYLDSVKQASANSLLDHGREALGQVRTGGLVSLSMIMGRTRADGPNFFAVFRDLSQTKKTESELLNARRQADRSATAKADVLARISHEVRTPLNAIIGFADVMIDQRFGPLGNERYGEYLRDIRSSGERVIAIVNDLLDLSRIETGKIDLAFSSQNLNEMVEQCVAVMQPQANRGRIIIRTSLAHLLPTVVADARALRQITLNLIGNSIHLANAGGQVIVSTALSDLGEVVLRVRDTGHGLNENEVAAALEPFRSSGPSDTESAGVSLSLTKALVEANHARFQIKSAPSSGTLIEVAFSNAVNSALKA